MILLDAVKGHNELVSKLEAAIQEQRLASTHIFVGPAGIGKKQVALGLAQSLLCENSHGHRACGVCGSCIRVGKQQHESLKIVTPEKHQIKIDQAREIISFTHLKSVRNATVIIIDGVDALNTQAANALLKVLEEPGEEVYFFAISNSLGSLLPTIRSRSQIWHFQPLSKEVMNSISYYPAWVVAASQGSLEIANELMADNDESLRPHVANLLKSLLTQKLENLLEEARPILTDKAQVLTVARLWQQMVRDAEVMKTDPNYVIHRDYSSDLEGLSQLSSQQLQTLFEQAQELEKGYYSHWDLNVAADHLVYKSVEVARGASL